MALPIDETDDAVLSTIEVLNPTWIKELLSLVDNAPDLTPLRLAERERLETEIRRLPESIAAGVPPESVAPLIKEKQAAIRKLDIELRKPNLPKLGAAKLRAVLEQRAAEWKADLRAEPQVARLVVRRLVAPITLWDEKERPDWCRWEAKPTLDLLDDLATTLIWRPHRDSNPGFSLERAAS